MRSAKTIMAMVLALCMLFSMTGCSKQNSGSAITGDSSVGNSATASPSEADKPKSDATIKWLHHYGEEATRQWIEEITAQYTAETGVKFDIVAVSNDDYQTLLKAKIASGDAPDLFDLTPDDLSQFIKNGYLEDVSGIDLWNNLQDGIKDNMTVDGKNYYVPLEANASGAFYNKDVFAAAGITKVPDTYSEFIKDLQILKDYGVAPIAFGAQEQWTITNDYRADMLQQVLRSNSNWMTQLENREIQITNDNVFLDTLNKFKERHQYGNDDQFGTDWNRATEMVATGKAAMVINGSWSIGAIEAKNPDCNIGVFPVPATENPDETLLTTWCSGGFVVYKDSSVKEQVLDFLNYLTGTESGTKWQDTAKRLSVIKGLPDAKDPALAEISKYMNEGKTFDVSATQNEFTGQFWDANVNAITEFLMSKDETPEEAAAAIDKSFDGIANK